MLLHEAIRQGYAYSTDEVIILGAIVTVLVVEGLRRSAGYVLLAVVGAVLVALFGSSEAERSTEANEMHVPLPTGGSQSTCSPATNG